MKHRPALALAPLISVFAGCAEPPPPPPPPPPAALGTATTVAELPPEPPSSASAKPAEPPPPPPAEGDVVVLARNLSVSSALAADENQVYWMNDADGTLMRIGSQRSGIKMMVYSAPGPFVAQPSLWLDRTTVYWTMQLAAKPGSTTGGTVGSVMKQDKTGGSPTTVVSGVKEDLKSVTTDASNIYWISGSSIMRASKDKDGPKAGAMATGQKNPTSVAADGQMIYWTNRASGGDDGAVMRMSVVGGAPAVFAAKQEKPSNLWLDSDTVYWVAANKVMKQPKKGGGGATVVVTSNQPITDMAIDETHVYWVAGSGAADGVVQRAPKAGGDAETLASNQNKPAAIALDDNNVYWLSRGTEENGYKDGTLSKKAK